MFYGMICNRFLILTIRDGAINMQVLLCVVSVLFGGLSMIASIIQMKSENKPISDEVMAIGSLLLIAAAVCNISAQWAVV